MAGKEVVIRIRFGEDLPTQAQNKLRYAMEMGLWRKRWREAKEANDYATMDYLDREYERVGLP